MARKTTKKENTKQVEEVELVAPEWAFMELVIIGLTALKVKNMGAKAAVIEGEHTGENVGESGETPRDPQGEFEASKYIHPEHEWEGFRAFAIKRSMEEACTRVKWFTKVNLRTAVHVHGENGNGLEPGAQLVRIFGVDAVLERSIQRIGRPPNKIAYPTFRPMYPVGWYTRILVQYAPQFVAPAKKIPALLNIAGSYIGLLEERPHKMGGSCGLFKVATDDEIEKLTFK